MHSLIIALAFGLSLAAVLGVIGYVLRVRKVKPDPFFHPFGDVPRIEKR